MRFERLGWIVAAALAGGIAASGFQGSSEKSGTVDLVKVYNDSDLVKQQDTTLRAAVEARSGILDFLRQNSHMKNEDVARFRELSTKDTLTATEKAELERIKNDAQGSESKFRELSTKDKPTPAEISQLEELNRRRDNVMQSAQKWDGEFANELQQRQQKLQSDALDKVKDVVSQVAKAQGYTIVFSHTAAPYAAHDLTADALKAINKK